MEEFLQYYFAQIDNETLARFGAMAGVDNPGVPAINRGRMQEVGCRKKDLAERVSAKIIAMMTGTGAPSLFLEFLLDFYDLEYDLKQEGSEFAIVFNDLHNVCYPFFIRYALESCPPGIRRLMADRYGSDDTGLLCQDLRESVALRNWFRNNVSSRMRPERIMELYEIISLQNFSSGGESTFYQYVLPRLDQARGPLLDAGCGSGLSTLLASLSHESFCFDGCRHRVKSAGALLQAAAAGRKDITDRAFSLAAKELAMPDLARIGRGLARGQRCSREPEIRIWQGLIGKIPCPDQFFHTIICLDVIEHLPDPSVAVAELGRVAAREANLYVSAPTEYCSRQQFALEQEQGYAFPALLHLNHFNRQKLEGLFGESGFELSDYLVIDSLAKEEYLEAFPDSELFTDPLEEPVPLQILACFIKK